MTDKPQLDIDSSLLEKVIEEAKDKKPRTVKKGGLQVRDTDDDSDSDEE